MSLLIDSKLAALIDVEFMDKVQWFLRISFQWGIFDDGPLQCHMSQQAFIDGMLKKFNMSECSIIRSPYRSRYVIYWILQDGISPDNKPELATQF